MKKSLLILLFLCLVALAVLLALRTSSPLPERKVVAVEIATDSAFIPSEHGAADSRQLGLFLFSACLQPASGAAGHPTAAR